MDVFIFPSLWEGLGISLIEAQATGIKCVCSERIPSSAIVTDLVEVISLDKEAIYWANRIADIDANYVRTNCFQAMIEAGYEINSTVDYLESFYIKENG